MLELADGALEDADELDCDHALDMPDRLEPEDWLPDELEPAEMLDDELGGGGGGLPDSDEREDLPAGGD